LILQGVCSTVNTTAQRRSQRPLSDSLLLWRSHVEDRSLWHSGAPPCQRCVCKSRGTNGFGQLMNVEQLRRALADLPGEMPVSIGDSRQGWMENAGLYVAPAHIDRRVSGTYVYARHQDG